MTDVECVVLGGGVMGTATALALSRLGREVVLLEQFDVGHDRGSSHGPSRILRFAYFEHPDYARMVAEAHRGWLALERETGRTLLLRCGGLDIGPSDGELVSGALRACREHRLTHEYLDGSSLSARFPFERTSRVVAVYQPDACLLAAAQCVLSQAEQARRLGAVIKEHTRVVRIEPGPRSVRVTTEQDTFDADQVVVTAGSWTGRLLAALNLPLTVRRKVVAYFEPTDATPFDPIRFPVFIFQSGEQFYYGMGPFGHPGVKVADHSGGEIVAPDAVDRAFRPADEANIRGFLSAHLPAANGRCLNHDVCLYTLTPDTHFIIDRHPASDRVLLAAGFSGHGFKFAPLVGEWLAETVIHHRVPHRPALFALSRFGTPSGPTFSRT